VKRVGSGLVLLVVLDSGLLVLLAALKSVSLYLGAALVLLLSLTYHAAVLVIMRIRRKRELGRSVEIAGAS
jgi:hypothetical protein